jgi:hypothetical protein
MFRAIDDYDPYRNLTRQEAAKMLAKFAMNVLCRKPNLALDIMYDDKSSIHPDLLSYVRLAYQL